MITAHEARLGGGLTVQRCGDDRIITLDGDASDVQAGARALTWRDPFGMHARDLVTGQAKHVQAFVKNASHTATRMYWYEDRDPGQFVLSTTLPGRR